MKRDPEKTYISAEILFGAINEELEAGRKASFIVTGQSMWPFLCHGRDSVTIERVRFEELQRGDIVLLRTPMHTYMLHRITALGENRFETAGDGNCSRDGWFDRDCLMARTVSVRRKGKTISCSSVRWKFISAVWMKLFFVRPGLLKLCLDISKIKGRLGK